MRDKLLYYIGTFTLIRIRMLFRSTMELITTDSEPRESSPVMESDGGTTPEISRGEKRTTEMSPEANHTDAVYPHGIDLP